MTNGIHLIQKNGKWNIHFYSQGNETVSSGSRGAQDYENLGDVKDTLYHICKQAQGCPIHIWFEGETEPALFSVALLIKEHKKQKV